MECTREAQDPRLIETSTRRLLFARGQKSTVPLTVDDQPRHDLDLPGECPVHRALVRDLHQSDASGLVEVSGDRDLTGDLSAGGRPFGWLSAACRSRVSRFAERVPWKCRMFARAAQAAARTPADGAPRRWRVPAR